MTWTDGAADAPGMRRPIIEVARLRPALKRQLQTLQDALTRDSPDVRRIGVEMASPAAAVLPSRRATAAAAAARGQSASAARLIREFGEELTEVVFQPGIRAAYRDARRRAEDVQGGTGLHLRLMIDPKLEQALPWEALCDPTAGYFLFANNGMRAARAHEEEPDRDLMLEPGHPPVSILAMAPRARQLGQARLSDIDAAAEQAAMEAALKPLTDRGDVALVWTSGGDASGLLRGLSRPPNGVAWNIFHFIGHGGVSGDDRDRTGYVVMDDEVSLGGVALSGLQLSAFLAGPRRPRLVVLNCCRSAGAEQDGRFASVAATLIRGGIHAVIAMQFEITDGAAILFSTLLYKHLAEGLPLLEAVTLARMKLQFRSAEWITPALFMRAADGSLMRAATATGGGP